MARELDVETLRGFARHLAGEWLRPNVKSPSGDLFIGGPAYVIQDMWKLTYKDEFEFILNGDGGIKDYMGRKSLVEFEAMAKDKFSPREDSTFVELLKEKLAIDPDGNHIPGCRGTVQIGNRIVGTRIKVIKTRRFGEMMIPKNEYWPVYAGEPEERKLGNEGKTVDHLPPEADPWPVDILNANVPNISAECAILALDAVVDNLDEGSTAATIRGRTGTQPADPDAAETGTLLFTLTMSDPAFGAAADDADGTCSATAASITDDSSADATGTLTYCRVGATGTGADDHIDGSAGTASVDFTFNTASITSGATVSMSSFVVGLSQGSTAT